MARKNHTSCPFVPLILAYYGTGNERILSPIFEELTAELRSFSWKLGVKSFDIAHDLAQITVADILLQFREHKYLIDPEEQQGSGKFWAWAYQFHTYNVGEWRARRKRRPTLEDWDAETAELALQQLPDEDNDLEYVLHHQQAIDTIAAATQAMLDLHPLDRQAMYWVYFEGLLIKEAAVKLHMPEDVVSKRAAIALRRVRYCLLALGFRPSIEVYKAIAWVDTGELFKQPDPVDSKRMTESLATLGRITSLRKDLHAS